MKLFEVVKEAVTARSAAEYYGIKVGRNGMAVCPFHPDKNPSMKLDKRYHCFACQADGDVIDFTSRLFGLSSKEAALKLADSLSAFQSQPGSISEAYLPYGTAGSGGQLSAPSALPHQCPSPSFP